MALPDTSIPNAFAACVAAHPDRLAVDDGERAVGGADLARAAHRLAHALLGRLGPGTDPVGLALGKGTEWVGAVLGVLETGRPYLVLDPTVPTDRNRAIVADSAAPLVVTTGHTLAVAADWGAPILDVGRLDPSLPATPPGIAVSPEAAFNVVYTSGSSGAPKGVVQTHRNLLHAVGLNLDRFGVGPGDRLALLGPPGMSVSAVETFVALLGGAVLLPFPVPERGFARLATWLREARITTFHATPTAFRQILDALEPDAPLPDLRLVKLGGEPILRSDVEALWRHAPASRLRVDLGSTETYLVTMNVLDATTPLDTPVVPVGRPMPDAEVRLVGEDDRPVAAGEVGQIAVRSAFLSPGYWRRPDLTRLAYRSVPGTDQREFLTGDLGRWRDDGCLEHLGRLDSQVKVRGHRVELAEVEAALAALPGVGQVAVDARTSAAGASRLVAWVVPRPGAAPTPGELRAGVARTLPDFMVPSAFVLLERLPLLPAGKLDRRALPPPPAARPDLEVPLVPARTPLERRLAAIWCEVLELPEVGVHDDFLELGGDSLSAARIAARVRRDLGTAAPVAGALEQPTVERMARALESLEGADRQSPATPPKRRPGSRPPASFAQQRIWFEERLQPGSGRFHTASAWRAVGELDVAALGRALGELVARHEALRTVLEKVDGVLVQRVQPAPEVELVAADLSGLGAAEQETELGRRVAEEVARPFDLTRDLMTRLKVFRLGPREHALVFVQHHVASDHWSAGIYYRELAELYDAAVAGRPARLPELPIQYADHSERSRLEGPGLAASLGYWKRRFAEAPAPLELPADHPRPPVPSSRGGEVTTTLPGGLADRLAALGRTERATPFMTLLAAFAALLGEWSARGARRRQSLRTRWRTALLGKDAAGVAEVVIGCPVAGRDRPETEGLIGLFLNVIAIRVDVSGPPTFRQLLARVRTTTLDAYAHQELPFERLVAELRPGRAPGRGPLFDVMLVVHDEPVAQRRLTGVRLEPIALPPPAATYDLTLEVDRLDRLRLIYARDLFEPTTARGMLEEYRALLEAVADEPDLPPVRTRRAVPEMREGGACSTPPPGTSKGASNPLSRQ